MDTMHEDDLNNHIIAKTLHVIEKDGGDIGAHAIKKHEGDE